MNDKFVRPFNKISSFSVSCISKNFVGPQLALSLWQDPKLATMSLTENLPKLLNFKFYNRIAIHTQIFDC